MALKVSAPVPSFRLATPYGGPLKSDTRPTSAFYSRVPELAPIQHPHITETALLATHSYLEKPFRRRHTGMIRITRAISGRLRILCDTGRQFLNRRHVRCDRDGLRLAVLVVEVSPGFGHW
jgi:hypothetical protein